MPNIRDISLFLGRSSLSDEEVVRVNFNVDFSPEELSLEKGFIMHIILVDVHGRTDLFKVGANGIYRREEIDAPDTVVGEVYRDVIRPGNPTMRVERTRAWDFGELAPGKEEFRAIIAIIPRDWQFSPAMVQSKPVRIDLG